MQREYDDITAHNLWMQYRKWTGEDIGEPFLLAAEASDSNLERHSSRPPVQTQQRPRFDAMLRNQLERFGIKVQWLSRVVEYYEDVERGVGGVVTQGGWRYEADLVIAADGLESKSQELISGSAKKAKPTGRTNFRAAFPLDVVAANPLLNETFGLKDGRCPVQQVWTGPDDTRCIVQSYVDKHGENGRLCFRLAICEPEGGHRKESWDDDDAIYGEEMLRVVDSLPGWSEAMRTLVWLTPPGYILAWPLKHRGLRWTWHSPSARVLQLGDAAHPFPPTSDNGATQAIEDSVTIPECLAQAGKDQVTTAVKVHNLLRADRVSCCQLLDFIAIKTDLNSASEDFSKIPYKTPKWIWSLDPEKYAIENYARAAASRPLVAPGLSIATSRLDMWSSRGVLMRSRSCRAMEDGLS